MCILSFLKIIFIYFWAGEGEGEGERQADSVLSPEPDWVEGWGS